MRTLLLVILAAAGCGFGDNLALHGSGTCGDGHLDVGEGCDDGNRVIGDGCSDQCAVETPTPTCGNGVREVGEACDDGNSASGDGCSATCEVESVCGNGVREVGEACDDGNTTAGDGCSATCTVEGANACMLVPQGGCSGATPACDITAAEDGTTACRAVTAAGTFDSICHASTECASGFTCAHGDATGTLSWCMKMCDADNQCGGAPAKCAFPLISDGGDPLGVKVCSNKCFILSQTGCPAGTGCVGIELSTGDTTDCLEMGNRLDGQSCLVTTDCLPGSLCVSIGGVATCHSYCDVNDSTTCGVGQTCVGFTTPLTIGSTTFGACE